MKVEIRVVLCIAALFVAGEVWWCEDCGRGGFLPHLERRHAPRCPFRGLS